MIVNRETQNRHVKFEYFIFGYVVEEEKYTKTPLEFFQLIRRVEEEGKKDQITEIKNDTLIMKAYYSVKGNFVIPFETKENKRVTRLNLYFYMDMYKQIVFFDINKCRIENLPKGKVMRPKIAYSFNSKIRRASLEGASH